jgi:hypothetical protein
MARQFAVSGLRPVLTGAQSKVIEFPAPMNCRITQILLRIAEANAAGDAVFDVNIDDVSVYASPTDRAKIVAGQTSGTSVIDTEVSLNQMITVDLDSAPLGGISGLYVIVQLEDAPTVSQYIKNLYQQAVRRDPTGTELTNGSNSLNSGCGAGTTLAAITTLATTIFTSSEYTTTYGATNAEYVEDLYQAFLARPSDAGGKSFWVAQLVGGMTRADLRVAFIGSLEHVNQRVVGWCPNTLPLTNAIDIQGTRVDGTPPTDKQFLQYDVATGKALWTSLDYLSSVFDFKASVRAATTGTLAAYSASGGALTATSNGALAAQDGVTLVANDRLLVKNESGGNQKYNGIYIVTQVGDGSHPYILTRAADANTSAKVTAGIFVPITEGTANGDTVYWLTTNDPITLDTTALTFSQFGSSGSPTGSAGGDLTGTYPNPTIANDAVTYAKMQNVSATARILGRVTSGAGDVEELTRSDVLSIVFSGCRVSQTGTGGSGIANNTPVNIAFGSEEFDTDSYHDNATNNSRLTIPVTGYYRVDLCIHFTSGPTTGSRFLTLLANGAVLQFCSGAGTNQGMSLSIMKHFAVSDYVEMQVFQDSGGLANYDAFFSIHRVG